MGELGLSLTDFDRLTPDEFGHVWRRHMHAVEQRERSAWERTRTACICALMPYSTRALDPRKVLPLPWDKADDTATDRPRPGYAETMARYRQVMAGINGVSDSV